MLNFFFFFRFPFRPTLNVRVSLVFFIFSFSTVDVDARGISKQQKVQAIERNEEVWGRSERGTELLVDT